MTMQNEIEAVEEIQPSEIFDALEIITISYFSLYPQTQLLAEFFLFKTLLGIIS